MSDKCIIVGASHAAAQLILSLRQEGWKGEILLIGDEPYLPYQRPPLSKTFLSGDKTIEDLAIRPAAFYEKNRATFYHGRVVSINRKNQSIALENGEELNYDKLVLCTGARVRKLKIPGSDLNGVHYLRNISDVKGIQKYIAKGKSAVIIGGGYIGLETAASLRKQGMSVVVLEMEDRILQRVTAPELSDFYNRIHSEEGVKIVTNVSVLGIEGSQNVEKVICTEHPDFYADLVIVGIGVLPNVKLAEKANLTVNNGILVDEHCCTNDKNIFAAGDCTNHFNKTYSRQLRLESVPNASEQAKVVAASICGKEKTYNSLPWFWSDQYGLKLQIAGLSKGYDRVIIRGDKLAERSFAAFYFKGTQLIAADCVNRPQEFMLSKKIISEKLVVDPSKFADESIAVKELL